MLRKFLLIILLACSCSKKEQENESLPTILVTIAPYAYLVEKIAKETMKIEILVPPGMNLHLYDPTPKSVERIRKASLWFRIDEPFEKKIVEALKENRPTMEIVNLQKGLPLRGENAIALSPCEGNHDHYHGGEDLHTWLSPKLFSKQAERIATSLIALSPLHEAFYKNNLNALLEELDELDENLATTLKPFQGDAFLISHPSLGYFCYDYKLVQLSLECEGKDPRPRDVEEIFDRATQYKVRCVFTQQGFNNKGTEWMAKKMGVPIYQIDPYARNYPETMQKIAGYIAR